MGTAEIIALIIQGIQAASVALDQLQKIATMVKSAQDQGRDLTEAEIQAIINDRNQALSDLQKKIEGLTPQPPTT